MIAHVMPGLGEPQATSVCVPRVKCAPIRPVAGQSVVWNANLGHRRVQRFRDGTRSGCAPDHWVGVARACFYD